MRKPLSATIPEDLVSRMDEFVASSRGDFANRSHLIEQAVRAYLGDDLSLYGGLLSQAINNAKPAESSSLYETTTYPRLSMNVREKRAIAEEAVGLVEAGQDVFVDGSTTCIFLARAFARFARGLTVVTTSTLVCLELAKSASHRVVGVGGEFDPATASFAGSVCEASLRELHFDTVFVSTKGFLPDEGTYESNTATLRLKQVAAERCDRLVLLVDHTKFSQRSLCRVLDVAQIDTVITDSAAPEAGIETLRQAGCEVIVVEPPPEDAETMDRTGSGGSARSTGTASAVDAAEDGRVG